MNFDRWSFIGALTRAGARKRTTDEEGRAAAVDVVALPVEDRARVVVSLEDLNPAEPPFSVLSYQQAAAVGLNSAVILTAGDLGLWIENVNLESSSNLQTFEVHVGSGLSMVTPAATLHVQDAFGRDLKSTVQVGTDNVMPATFYGLNFTPFYPLSSAKRYDWRRYFLPPNRQLAIRGGISNTTDGFLFLLREPRLRA